MAEPVLRAEGIVKKLHGAFCRGATQRDLLELAARKIHDAGPPYTSVCVYMHSGDGDALKLAAFDGQEAEHSSIPVNRGVRAKAVTVLIRRNEEILGQIDIDSESPAGFNEAEHSAVAQVADALATLL